MATQDFRVHEKTGAKAYTGIPLRRRRFTLYILLCLAVIFFYFVPWELPAVVKEANLSSITRANIAQRVKTKQVDEIYGFLHLFTGPTEDGPTITTTALRLDPFSKNELMWYAAGDVNLNWQTEQKRINEEFPVVVFSKSYCPFSKRAKDLLEKYDLQPAPRIVEVDLREDANDLKQFLTRLTDHGTFPNVILKGKSIGGQSDLQALHDSDKLKAMLEEAGVKVKGDPNSV